MQLGSQEITCVLRERMQLLPGEIVHLSFRSYNVHFFHRATQQRLEKAPR